MWAQMPRVQPLAPPPPCCCRALVTSTTARAAEACCLCKEGGPVGPHRTLKAANLGLAVAAEKPNRYCLLVCSRFASLPCLYKLSFPIGIDIPHSPGPLRVMQRLLARPLPASTCWPTFLRPGTSSSRPGACLWRLAGGSQTRPCPLSKQQYCRAPPTRDKLQESVCPPNPAIPARSAAGNCQQRAPEP